MSKGINKTGYKGVNKIGKLYQSTINIRQKRLKKSIKIYVGYYETPQLAYIARCEYLDSLK